MHPMITLDHVPSHPVRISHEPASNQSLRCEQVVHSATGERPLWVQYDPSAISRIAHLWSPTNSARYLLGAAGYKRCQTLATGELWVQPANPSHQTHTTHGPTS